MKGKLHMADIITLPNRREHFLKPGLFLDTASYLVVQLERRLAGLASQLTYQSTEAPDGAMTIAMDSHENWIQPDLAYQLSLVWDESTDAAKARVVKLGVKKTNRLHETSLVVRYQVCEGGSGLVLEERQVDVDTQISSRSHRRELVSQLACSFIEFFNQLDVQLIDQMKANAEECNATFKDFQD